MSEALSLLVIGYGNSLRRDDGAGLLLAERLASCWREAGLAVQLIQTHQLMPEMAEEIAAESVTHAIFVDTVVAENLEAGVQIVPISSAAGEQSLGHQMDPSMLLAYAEKLYGRAPACHVVTIPGFDFGFGDELSAAIQRTLDSSAEIAQRALALLSISQTDKMTG